MLVLTISIIFHLDRVRCPAVERSREVNAASWPGGYGETDASVFFSRCSSFHRLQSRQGKKESYDHLAEDIADFVYAFIDDRP